MSDGHTSVNNATYSTGGVQGESFYSAAIYAGVGTQGGVVSFTLPDNTAGSPGNVILVSINGSYSNAVALQNALSHDSTSPPSL